MKKAVNASRLFCQLIVFSLLLSISSVNALAADQEKKSTLLSDIVLLSIAGILLVFLVYLRQKSKKLQKLAEKSADWEQLATHDELTGVLNREAYKEIKEQLNQQNVPTAFIMIDIDHFREFNEEYGHEIGDQLLKKTADILRRAIRSEDYLFRFGGSKFLILVFNANMNEQTADILKTRFITVSEILSTGDQVAPAAHFSAGVSFSKGGINNECYQIADAALYHSKQNGYAGWTVMDGNKNVVYEFHDTVPIDLRMPKHKLMSSVKTGAWRIEIPKDDAPRLFGDETMLELLGIEKKLSPEECYEHWFSRVCDDYVSMVLQAVDKIAGGKRAEVLYLWKHPKMGIRHIRCGGMADEGFLDGRCIYGFHQDMSEIEVVLKEDDIQYMMNAMNDYLVCNIYFDLNTMRYTVVKQTKEMAADGIKNGTISHLTEELVPEYISALNQEEMRKLLRMDDLEERIRNKQRISCDYIDAKSKEWYTARLIPVRYDSVGKLQSIMVEVLSIDAEKKLKLQQEQRLLMIRTAYKRMFSYTQNFFGLVNVNSGLVTRLDTDADPGVFSKETPYEYNIVMNYAAEHSVAPADKEKYLRSTSLKTIQANLEQSHEYVFTINRQKADGTTGLFANHFCYYDEAKENIIVMIEEITDREEKDIITEEANLQGFMRQTAHVLEHQTGEYAMLHFDLKGFKAINAQFGFERGNELLKCICSTIKESALKPYVIARSSGDHFYCLVRKEYLNYHEILRLCKQNLVLENTSVSVAMRCGIYEIVDKSMPVRSMCDRARLAETAIKDDSTGCLYYVFTEELNKKYLQQNEILSSLDAAVEHEEFYNYYQPIYDAKTKELASAEALVRWIKPDGQIVPPDAFIPTLEENGQISVVDMFTGVRIQQFQQERYVQGKKIIPISVNLSRVDLYNDELLEHLYHSVKSAKAPCEYMRFEITESAYTEIPDHALQVMRMMRECGAKILIDDFGKGYSSLSTLTEQIFDIVKLDMSFIEQIGKSTRAEAVITTSIDLVHKMNAKVVAEGVETQEQYEFLRDADCDYIQGYYFSKPLPQSEFEVLLN